MHQLDLFSDPEPKRLASHVAARELEATSAFLDRLSDVIDRERFAAIMLDENPEGILIGNSGKLLAAVRTASGYCRAAATLLEPQPAAAPGPSVRVAA